MKRTTQIMAALLTVISSVAFATGDEKEVNKTSSVEVMLKEPKVFHLVYKSENADRVSIKIMNENNRVVFSESIKKYDAFTRPYNLSLLPEGIYTVEVTDQFGTTKRQIHNFKYTPSTVALPHIVKLDQIEDQKYKLTIVNQGVNAANISIYDAKNDLVYKGFENLDGNFAKLYNLSRVNAKTVEVVVNGQVTSFEL